MAINIGNFVVKGKEPKVQTPAPPANLRALNVGQLVVINQPVVEEVEFVEEAEDLDEAELNAEMEGLIELANAFYDREMERYEKE